jgi:alpha-L-rhamnosidase
MNSFNHYAFGAVGEYLYGGVGGIQPASPGYKTINIRPVIGAGVNWAKTALESPYGRIATDWKVDASGLQLDVTIPPNTTATISVPTTDAASVTESGQPAAKAKSVKFLRQEPGGAVYAVGAGRCRFHSTLPQTSELAPRVSQAVGSFPLFPDRDGVLTGLSSKVHLADL